MNVESKKVSDRRTMSNLCAVVPLQSHEHQVTLHMPRQVTAAQKRARDALAEAIEIKHDCFFSMAQKTHTKIFFQDLKVETEILGTFFRFYMVLYYFTRKILKKGLLKLELSKDSSNNPILG